MTFFLILIHFRQCIGHSNNTNKPGNFPLIPVEKVIFEGTYAISSQ